MDKSADEDFSQVQLERTLPKDDWIKAVINGADDHSPRWRHLLILGGLLLGFSPVEDENLSRSMRSTLESALVTAVNLYLDETAADDDLGYHCITLVLNHCFPSLPDHERAQLNYDALLPILVRTTLHSTEGLRSAYFLGAVDLDVKPISKSQFRWPERSASFQQVQSLLSSPLLSSLGPLSRLIGHTIDNAVDSWLVCAVVEDLETFAKTLHLQWRQNKLSEIDASEERLYLDAETCETTIPQLWKLLRSTLFAVVIIQCSAVGRVLGDGTLANDEGMRAKNALKRRFFNSNVPAVAPKLAMKALQTLRSLYFVSTKIGSASFSQYNFVYLTAMDILAAYPSQAETFLHTIKSPDLSAIPQHPLDRCVDLFFLNTAEHFTLVLPPHTNEELLVAAATPYLAAGGNNNLLAIFEAAHSVMLAVFSAPQNAEITTRHLPFYIDALFKVFPQNLSSRQFRLAFKTLLRLTSPPAALAASEPMLSATLLELLHERANQSSTLPLPPNPTDSTSQVEPPVDLSEQAVLTLTVIDTLTHLPLDLLDEWLPLAADLVNQIEDAAMRQYCKEHFWHVLVGGEMDPNRSGLCHAWWSTRGGREMLLFGRETAAEDIVQMSGALPDELGESKL